MASFPTPLSPRMFSVMPIQITTFVFMQIKTFFLSLCNQQEIEVTFSIGQQSHLTPLQLLT